MTDLDYNIATADSELRSLVELCREYDAKATKYSALAEIIKAEVDRKRAELADLEAQKDRREEYRKG